MIRPDSRYNTPPLEGDWARHPCCGTICTACRVRPSRSPHMPRGLAQHPMSSMDGGQDYVLDSYDLLPELSFFDPIMSNVDVPLLMKKLLKLRRHLLWYFPSKVRNCQNFRLNPFTLAPNVGQLLKQEIGILQSYNRRSKSRRNGLRT